MPERNDRRSSNADRNVDPVSDGQGATAKLREAVITRSSSELRSLREKAAAQEDFKAFNDALRPVYNAIAQHDTSRIGSPRWGPNGVLFRDAAAAARKVFLGATPEGQRLIVGRFPMRLADRANLSYMVLLFEFEADGKRDIEIKCWMGIESVSDFATASAQAEKQLKQLVSLVQETVPGTTGNDVTVRGAIRHLAQELRAYVCSAPKSIQEKLLVSEFPRELETGLGTYVFSVASENGGFIVNVARQTR